LKWYSKAPYTASISSIKFSFYQLIPYHSQVHYFSESILGLPEPPWAYEIIGCTEEDIIRDMGLIKVFPSQNEHVKIDKASPYLFFPSKEISAGPEESPQRTQDRWKMRQDLAYFLNVHFLSQEYWVNAMKVDFRTTLANPWYPGKGLSSSSLFTTIDGGSPYISVDCLYILATDGSAPRRVNREDQLASDTPFHWEIYREGIHGERFLSGRIQWTSTFNTHLRKRWQSIGTKIQTQMRLTPTELWRKLLLDPDVAV
jgi:hypothetical protein